MKTAFLAFAAIATLGSAVPASAQRVTIDFSDLDLATPGGQKTLDQRIVRATRKACGFYDSRTGTRLVPPEAVKCAADLQAQARQKIAALADDQRKGG